MKVNQSAVLSSRHLEECARLGRLLARLRIARKVKDAALRAGLARLGQDWLPCGRLLMTEAGA